MDNAMIPQAFRGAVADPAFGLSKVDPRSLSEGVAQSFPILSIRGKVFRLKYKGQESAILDAQTGQPVQSLDVVILSASPVISKIYYEAAFVENQREAPDCFSINGLNPDPASPKKQAQWCATCPQNIWGSRTVNGKAAKACQDNKRLAVTPADDMKNELFGGPALLRIPPASLQDMSQYQTTCQQFSQQYFTVRTRLSFDYEVAHPKIKFAPIQPLSGELARLCVELQEHTQVKRMLSEGVEFVKGEEGDPPAPPPAVAPTGQPQHAQGFPQPVSPPVVTPSAPPPPAPPPMPPSGAGFGPGPQVGSTVAGPGFVMGPGVIPGQPQPAVVPGVAVGDPGPMPEHLRRQPQAGAGIVFGGPGQQTTAQPAQGPAQAAPAPAQSAPAPTDPLAAMQAEMERLKAQLAEATKPKATRKGKAPPSPQPTAAVATPQPATAAVATPPAVSSTPQGGIVFGALPAQAAPDVAEASAGLALPGDLDGELDKLLK